MTSAYMITAAICFHAVSTAVGANMRRSTTEHPSLNKNPFDFRKHFDPPEMLIVSSPMERKVSFTQIKDFKSIDSVVLPILDAGIIAPYGIAWDAARSALYVCDGSLRKIFRVKIKAVDCLGADCKGMPYKLAMDGNMDTVVQNTLTQWVSVDGDGNLYYSDQEAQSVDKLNIKYIEMILEGNLNPADMGKTTEPEAAGEEAAKESIEENQNMTELLSVTQTTTPLPKIQQLYQIGESPNVGTPSGVVTSGPYLYWANQVGGFSSGSVAYGKTNPRVRVAPDEGSDRPSFPSSKLVNNSGSSYGIAVTHNKVIYTDAQHYVWAASRGTAEVVALTKSMLKPRGLVWDGDNTVYVADEEANFVGSMPVGRLLANAPVTHTLDIHSPYGVAFVGKNDPVWATLREQYGESGANRVAGIGALVMVVVSMAVASRL